MTNREIGDIVISKYYIPYSLTKDKCYFLTYIQLNTNDKDGWYYTVNDRGHIICNSYDTFYSIEEQHNIEFNNKVSEILND